jgi:hypothetical protein
MAATDQERGLRPSFLFAAAAFGVIISALVLEGELVCSIRPEGGRM